MFCLLLVLFLSFLLGSLASVVVSSPRIPERWFVLVARTVLWFGGRVWCKILCFLGFVEMLVTRVDILSVSF